MERLQRRAAAARFVKAFSCVGAVFMVKPDFGGWCIPGMQHNRWSHAFKLLKK